MIGAYPGFESDDQAAIVLRITRARITSMIRATKRFITIRS